MEEYQLTREEWKRVVDICPRKLPESPLLHVEIKNVNEKRKGFTDLVHYIEMALQYSTVGPYGAYFNVPMNFGRGIRKRIPDVSEIGLKKATFRRNGFLGCFESSPNPFNLVVHVDCLRDVRVSNNRIRGLSRNVHYTRIGGDFSDIIEDERGKASSMISYPSIRKLKEGLLEVTEAMFFFPVPINVKFGLKYFPMYTGGNSENPEIIERNQKIIQSVKQFWETKYKCD